METKEQSSNWIKKAEKLHYVILVLILALSFFLRVIGLGWGLPRTDTYGDDYFIFKPAYDCVKNNTFEVHEYYRPNHVSAKVHALAYFAIQNLYFEPKGLTDFEQNFEEHLAMFFKTSRIISALFGVGIVLLAYLIVRFWGRKQALLAAFLFAVFPSLVEHSHYLVPDVPLLFFLMGVVLSALYYHKKPSVGWLLGMSLFTALATCEKYPGAYGCLIIAVAVIVTNLKKIGTIIKHGLLAILFFVLGIMAVSPNLLIDYKTVLEVMASQNKQYHIGADGLNFGQTLVYYLKTAATRLGLILSALSIFGTVYSIRKNTKQTIILLPLLVYIIPISVLSVHWERYTFPIYAFGIIFGVIGGFALLEFIKKISKDKKIVTVITCILLFVLPSLSIAFAGAAAAARFTVPDSRLYLMDEFAAMDVTKENTVFDCNTPLDPGGFYGAFSDFDEWDPAKYKYGSKMFVMTSSAQRDLFLEADPERYGAVAKFYQKLDDNYPLVYKYTPANPSCHVIEAVNIKNAIKTLSAYAKKTASGYEIRLYQLQ